MAVVAGTGLEGVVAATTRLSHVDGERGELVIAGYPIDELAERATFEETTWLLWHGDLPSAASSRPSGARSRGASNSSATLALLRECARRDVEMMDALRMAAGHALARLGRPDRHRRACSDDRRRLLAAAAGRSRLRRAPTLAMPRTSCTC